MGAFIRQNINPWLCMILISLMAFWTVLYYFTNKARAIAAIEENDRAELMAEYR